MFVCRRWYYVKFKKFFSLNVRLRIGQREVRVQCNPYD